METVNTNDVNIKEIVDRMTKIKAEEKTLSEEYALLQAQLQMIGESDLEIQKESLFHIMAAAVKQLLLLLTKLQVFFLLSLRIFSARRILTL